MSIGASNTRQRDGLGHGIAFGLGAGSVGAVFTEFERSLVLPDDFLSFDVSTIQWKHVGSDSWESVQ